MTYPPGEMGIDGSGRQATIWSRSEVRRVATTLLSHLLGPSRLTSLSYLLIRLSVDRKLCYI